jgi:hypothetical protein
MPFLMPMACLNKDAMMLMASLKANAMTAISVLIDMTQFLLFVRIRTNMA